MHLTPYVVPPRILWWLVADLVTRWRAPFTSARADSTGGGPLQQCLSRSLSHFQHRARRAVQQRWPHRFVLPHPPSLLLFAPLFLSLSPLRTGNALAFIVTPPFPPSYSAVLSLLFFF